MRKLVLVLAVVLVGALVVAAPIVAKPGNKGPGKQGGSPSRAVLTGAAEVPGPGDPDGSGTARVVANPGKAVVCYELRVRDIEPATAAHIHEGAPDVAGPVVVNLDPPTDGSSSGCVKVARALARDIARTPSDYYVNVHNTEFPAGAVRGQLSRR